MTQGSQEQAPTRFDLKNRSIKFGEPDKLGKGLTGRLAGYRRIRTGSTRIVYRVNAQVIEVLIVAIGQRRDAEVYADAEKRVLKKSMTAPVPRSSV